MEFRLRAATPQDVATLVRLIGELAAYEKLEHLMQATPQALETHLFGPRPVAEALIAEFEPDEDGQRRAVGFAGLGLRFMRLR